MSLINYISGFYKSSQNKHNSDNRSLSDVKDSPLHIPNQINKKPSFDNIIFEGNHTRISQYFKENNGSSNPEYEKMLFLSCDELKIENKGKITSQENLLFSYESFVLDKPAICKIDEIDINGTLVLTSYRFFFKQDTEEIKSSQEEFLSVPLLMITKLEKNKILDKKYTIDVTTKDNKNLKFIVNDDENSILYDYIAGRSFQKEIKGFYSIAYEYHKKREKPKINGWEIYDPIEEYSRQGLDLKTGNSKLRLSEVNINYTICETYPEKFVVPRFFSDEEIQESRGFRTKNRLPVFCWINKENKASLWRSSQTKSGLTHQRSNKDESLLKLIGDYSDGLIIYDARPYINALANRVFNIFKDKLKGAGFENTDYYKNTAIQFCEIDNIHAVRNSLLKVYNLCKINKLLGVKKFYALYEQSGWTDFIILLLKTACSICASIQKNSTVLIHCSDGWDRTTQLISLVELFLDPYYRSIKGFIVLVEKEWLSLGHQFGVRNGLYLNEMKEEQSAPIFLQWLDCLHQLLYQNPSKFEFNISLLLFLAYHHQNTLYGTFIFNSEKERKAMNYKRTVSIWTDVLDNIQEFENPFYSFNNEPLSFDYSPYRMRFWEEYFLMNNYSYSSYNGKISFHRNIVIQIAFKSFEVQKKEYQIITAEQEKEINRLKSFFKDIYKLGFMYDFKKDLSEKSRQLMSEIVNSDEELKSIPSISYDYFKIEKVGK